MGEAARRHMRKEDRRVRESAITRRAMLQSSAAAAAVRALRGEPAAIERRLEITVTPSAHLPSGVAVHRPAAAADRPADGAAATDRQLYARRISRNRARHAPPHLGDGAASDGSASMNG